MKRKNKGFTLIELLAVIVILGLLMAIAIPSVTKYINQSRKKTIMNTIDNYIKSVSTDVNDMSYSFTEPNKIYAVPIDCIAVEKGGKNPLGELLNANSEYWAYVLVQYDSENDNYKYGFTFKDSKNNGLIPMVQALLVSDGSQIKSNSTLTRPTTDKSVEDWSESGFKTDDVTLQVLQPKLEGNGKTTCTLAQKGSNYADVKNDVENEDESETAGTKASDYIIALATKGDTTIYHHNGTNENDANDESYRYMGANADVNNYVCFGSDEETCPEDNLYRIIGVFGENIKLVKSTSIGGHYWNSTDGTSATANSVTTDGTTYYNYWYYKDTSTGEETSATLNEYLNNDFYNSLDLKWQNMIASHEWNIGGHTGAPAVIFYTAEQSAKWTGKIGLITPSEYGYAADSSYWTTALKYYKDAAYQTDWLLLSGYQWTMARYSSNTYSVGYVHSSGDVRAHDFYNGSIVVRPSFYLDSSVKILDGGEGTSSSPYRLSV